MDEETVKILQSQQILALPCKQLGGVCVAFGGRNRESDGNLDGLGIPSCSQPMVNTADLAKLLHPIPKCIPTMAAPEQNPQFEARYFQTIHRLFR